MSIEYSQVEYSQYWENVKKKTGNSESLKAIMNKPGSAVVLIRFYRLLLPNPSPGSVFYMTSFQEAIVTFLERNLLFSASSKKN